MGQKLAARRGESCEPTGSNGVDVITLFPGWATRRYGKAAGDEIGGTSSLVR